MRPSVSSVRQLKIWVTDLDSSRTWYENVFGLERVLSFEDRDGAIRGMAFRVPRAPFELALRENRELATALAGADPFALASTRKSLDAWTAHLDPLRIPHSGIHQASRGPSLGFRDPDGLQIWRHADDPEVAASVGDVCRDRGPE